METRYYCFAGLTVKTARGIDRQRVLCSIEGKATGLIAPCPYARNDAAKLLRQLKAKFGTPVRG